MAEDTGHAPGPYDPAAAGLRVARLRTHLGWSTRELGRRAQLSPTYVGNFERGQEWRARPVTRDRLAQALGWPDFTTLMASSAITPPAALNGHAGLDAGVTELGPDGSPISVDNRAALALNGRRGRHRPGAVELPWGLFLSAPIQGRANMGGGTGYVAESITVPVGLVHGRNFAAWEVAGNCMEPELSMGDIVLIDLDQRPADGAVVVAKRENGDVLLKRYYRRAAAEQGGPARVELRPNIEASGVGELVVVDEDEPGFRIVGVVFYMMRAVGRRRLDGAVRMPASADARGGRGSRRAPA